jgi:hypothetical protein
MHDTLCVRVRDGVDGRVQELDDVRPRATVQATRPPLGEFVRERSALEPLEDRVGTSALVAGAIVVPLAMLRTMCRLPWDSL